MYEAYIFDLDGTLLDTLDDLTDAINYALTTYQRPIRTREEVRSFIGNGLAKLVERVLENTEHDDIFHGVYATFKSRYRTFNRVKTKPYDGVENMLKTLFENGKKVAVVSNKADDAVRELIGFFFPQIPVAIGEDDGKGRKRKPDPSTLFEAVNALCVDVKNAVYIGDSEIDLQTAKNAGMDCISVTWGFKTAEFLQNNGAKTLVKAPEEILRVGRNHA